MQKSINPDEGISGAMLGFRSACSQRQIQSPTDPASFESYVELMRQGAAGAGRIAAASRILQREAHRTSLMAKAAMGALYKAGEDPFRYINIQFDKKANMHQAGKDDLKNWVAKQGPAESEGDRVRISMKNQKDFKGEYSGRSHLTAADEVMERKKQMLRQKNKAQHAKGAMKNRAKEKMAERIQAKTKGVMMSDMFLELGPDGDAAAIATALVAANARTMLVQRTGAAFFASEVPESTRSQRYRNPGGLRDFL